MARLLVLFITAFIDMVGLTMVIPILPFYATDFGASAGVVGVLISAFSLAPLIASRNGAELPFPGRSVF